jgi:hypothetical protein
MFEKRDSPRTADLLFVFATSFLSIGLLALVAMVSGTPLVFPSLGPTAFMLFHDPNAEASSARNTILGHAIGIACGFAALWMTGLASAAPTMSENLNLARVLCAAIALGSTGLLMSVLKLWHPPAGATTLIVALGFITQPYHLLVMEAAVVVLVVLALGINRLAAGRQGQGNAE